VSIKDPGRGGPTVIHCPSLHGVDVRILPPKGTSPPVARLASATLGSHAKGRIKSAKNAANTIDSAINCRFMTTD